jgi:hypothetical protein
MFHVKRLRRAATTGGVTFGPETPTYGVIAFHVKRGVGSAGFGDSGIRGFGDSGIQELGNSRIGIRQSVESGECL